MFGYHGRYLRIDLTARRAAAVLIAPEVYRATLGGTGLGTWLMRRESTPGQDPLGPAAPICFVFSPLVGTPLTTSAKFAVVGHSPLTGCLNDSLSSSHYAISGKRTGCDAIVLVGACEEPTLVVVDDGQVRFVPADALWGLSSAAASEQARGLLGQGFRVAMIGPAGERLVRYATVSHDGRHAGRGGHGAVLGAKRVKGLAVRGTQRTPVAFPDELVAYSRDLSQRSFGPATAKYRELGTVGNLLTFNRLGTLPTRNFQAGTFEGAEPLAPESLSPSILRTRESCAACTIGCEHIFHRADSGGAVRMEYENLFALGPLCGVSDPDVVLAASQLCDELGLDTISAGGTIAFAMECAERGLLDAPALRFGHGPALLDTLRRIGARSGLGDLLAEGSRRAARAIGHGSEAFAPQVKGLEIPGYEPRALQSMALGFAVGTRGADHNRSGAYQVDFSERVNRRDVRPEDVPLAVETENEAVLMDSLILCKFLRGVFEDKVAAMAEMLRLVTGWDVTREELVATAGRIVTEKKRFNIAQGWTPADDVLPARFLAEPLAAGTSAGARLTSERLQALIRAYNLARGWSPDGYPPHEATD